MIKRVKESIKRSKQSIYLTSSIFFDHFQYKFDLFQFQSTFSIQSEHDLINFVMIINLDSKNSDQNFD